jgi:hypothetical protein
MFLLSCSIPKTYFKETILFEKNPVVSTKWEKDMPKFAIAFIVPESSSRLCHKIIENDTKDAALRKFFNDNVSDHYSNDEQGYYYFKEDFYDENGGGGSLIEL